MQSKHRGSFLSFVFLLQLNPLFPFLFHHCLAGPYPARPSLQSALGTAGNNGPPSGEDFCSTAEPFPANLVPVYISSISLFFCTNVWIDNRSLDCSVSVEQRFNQGSESQLSSVYQLCMEVICLLPVTLQASSQLWCTI